MFKPLESETSAFLSSPPLSSAHLEANLATTPVTSELVVSWEIWISWCFSVWKNGKTQIKNYNLNNHTPENHDNGKNKLWRCNFLLNMVMLHCHVSFRTVLIHAKQWLLWSFRWPLFIPICLRSNFNHMIWSQIAFRIPQSKGMELCRSKNVPSLGWTSGHHWRFVALLKLCGRKGNENDT